MIKFLKTIFVSVVLMFAIMQIANATEQPITPETETPKEYQFKGLYWLQMPVICGRYQTVSDFIESKNYILVYVAVGRVGGKESGEPAFMIQEYITEDMSKVISVVTSPNMQESCIMYSGFDVQFKRSTKAKGTGI